MRRFDPDCYYRTDDPALAILATRGTMSQWRHQGTGPRYTRLGRRVLYLGKDLNDFLDRHVIETSGSPGRGRGRSG